MGIIKSLSFLVALFIVFLELNGCSPGSTCPATPARPPLFYGDKATSEGVRERDLSPSISGEAATALREKRGASRSQEQAACGSQ